MKRNQELKYLLWVLLFVSIGFLLLSEALLDRDILTAAAERGISSFTSPLFNCISNPYIPLSFVTVFLLFHVYLRVRLPEADPLLLPAVALLTGVGLIMMLRLAPELAIARSDALEAIQASRPGLAVKNNVQTLALLGIKQSFFVITGILAAIAAINLFNDRFVSRISSKKYIWVVLSVLLILATLCFGSEINGKRLWLFGMQPVEGVKLLMVLFMAGYMYEKGKGITTVGRMNCASWFTYGGPFIIMCLFALAPLLIQGDLGPTLLLFIVFILLFQYSGNRGAVTCVFVALLGIAGYVSYRLGYPPIVRDRFDIVLDPFGTSENMSRVLWSISSGGFWGTGIGYGQPFRIPEVQSDFNFAAICEEAGLAGGLAVVLAYALFIQRCLRIAFATTGAYKKTLVVGIATLFGVQSFIIIAGNLNCIPLTGITLPFVSYGGSSMIISFIAAGIVLRVSGEKA
jgi:cell division protein FtsW (lipid II flippase)